MNNVYPFNSPSSSSASSKNVASTLASFTSAFSHRPDFCVRAPGRVNLIGEHIDYSGFCVLPMAISRDVAIAVKVLPSQPSNSTGPQLTVKNVDSEKFPCASIPLLPEAEMVDAPFWARYCQCGVKGFMTTPKTQLLSFLRWSGSSRAAFLPRRVSRRRQPSWSRLSYRALSHRALAPTQLPWPLYRRRLKSTLALAGGMDQAASCLSETGYALKIDFLPSLSSVKVTLPLRGVMVVSHSLAESSKAIGPEKRFNLRAVEVRLAALVMSSGRCAKLCECDRADLEKLHVTPYAKADVESLGLDFGFSESMSRAYAQSESFELRKRAQHVFEEHERVLAFERICGSAEKDDLRALGALMDASHASCRDLYDCSCAELDKLVATAKAAGAYGSRLTGAGWGGCAVSLVDEAHVGAFVDQVALNYYGKSAAVLEESGHLFCSRPGRGAYVYII